METPAHRSAAARRLGSDSMELDFVEIVPLVLGIMATGAVAGVLSGPLGVGGA